MARGRKPKTADAPPPATEPAGMAHNLTQVEFVKHADRIAELNSKLAAARQDLKTAYDDAEKAGIDKRALKASFKVLKMVSHERREHFATLGSYLRWMNVPVGTQFGMFQAEVDDAEPPPPASTDEGYSYQAGYQARREGRPREDGATVPAVSRRAWMTGFDQAEMDIAEEARVSSGTGTPRKAGPAEQQPAAH